MALPTIEEMFGHTLVLLDASRNGLGDARDELNSDWCARPTKRQMQARRQVFELIGQAKALIDEAKSAIYEAGD